MTICLIVFGYLCSSGISRGHKNNSPNTGDLNCGYIMSVISVFHILIEKSS